MNPIISQHRTSEDLARWGVRGMGDFSVEELARLQQKVEEWVRQRGPYPLNKRHRNPFVMKRRNTPPV